MRIRIFALAGVMLVSLAGLAWPGVAPAGGGGLTPPPDIAPPAPVAAPESVSPLPGEELFASPVSGKVKSRLNVRVTPVADSRIPLLGTLDRDEPVTAIGRLGKWLRIRMPDRLPLWVSAQFVDLPAGGTFPATGTLKADKVRLRASGDLKSPALKELPRGAQVEVLGKVNDWLKVKAPPDVTAWVYGDYVTLAAAPQALPPAPVKAPGPPVPAVAAARELAPEPAEPTELQGPGVMVFAEAEAAFRKAQGEDPPDYTPAWLLYAKALAVKGLPDAVKNTCLERLREIDAKLTDEQRKQLQDRQRAEFAEKVRQLREEAEKLKAQLPPTVEPAYTAKGLLSRTPDLPGMPGPYKLTVSGVLLYYVKPVGPAVNLDPLVDKQVGVVGQKRFVAGWGTELIDVVEAQQIGALPEN